MYFYSLTQLVTLKIVQDTIPAMRERANIYSNQRKKVEIPINLKAVVEGEIQRVWIHAHQGTVWTNTLEAKISAKGNEKLRTFETKGVVVQQGSDRQLHVRLLECVLTADDPVFQRGENVVYEQPGNSASAVFDITVDSDDCGLHSGEFEFLTVSRRDDDNTGGLVVHEVGTVWVNKQDDFFIVEWVDFDHLDDGNELIEINDIDFNECHCLK